MTKIDSRTIMSFGVGIELGGPVLVADEVQRLLPNCDVELAEIDRLSFTTTAVHQGSKLLGYEIRSEDGGLVTRQQDPLRAAEKLVDTLHFEVASRSTEFTFVHAGVVGVGNGALILPGRSMAGKSTLVSALLQRGASYLSDEYAVIDRDGRVHPYARNLRIRAEDFSTRTTSPREFTDSVEHHTLPLTHIALLRYESGKSIDVEPIGGASAALALVDNTVRARLNPEATLKASSLAADAEVVRGIRGEAKEAASWLLSWANR